MVQVPAQMGVEQMRELVLSMVRELVLSMVRELELKVGVRNYHRWGQRHRTCTNLRNRSSNDSRMGKSQMTSRYCRRGVGYRGE